MNFSPDWGLIGFLLIVIGLVVQFEVRVKFDDQEEDKEQKELKG